MFQIRHKHQLIWLRIALFIALSMALLIPTYIATLQARAAESDPITPAQVDQPLAPLSRALRTQFSQSTASVSFLVVLDKQFDAQSVTEDAVTAAGAATRGELIYRRLTEQALQTQAPLRAWLDANHIRYTPFYLVNMIEVEGDQQVAEAIRAFAEVNRLEANPQVDNQLEIKNSSSWLQELRFPSLESSTELSAASTQAAPAATLPYGLSFTHADQLWAMGYRGQGIVIASQDTGVQWDHPALKPAYRGYISATDTISHTYNWLDAIDGANRPARCVSDAAVPCDDGDHGTHTVGTMLGDATPLGDTILGMAPAAQWIACRNMDNGFGTPARYTTCFEFMLAPYPQGGDKFSEGHPELAPQVINNSWGCPPVEGCDATSLRQIVETVRAAGIMVVASAGNNGSSCSTVNSPIAIHDATFTVGAFNSAGSIASFSSRGPVLVDGSLRRKPDISAPGVDVRSTGLGSNVNSFKSGTSMASPHVAGAVALLYSAAPQFIGNPDLTEQVLIKSATPVASQQCPVSQVGNFPNNVYGFGQLDILAAVKMAQQPASLAVEVVDCSLAPVNSQSVKLLDGYTDFVYSATTDANGIATFPTVIATSLTDTFSVTVPAMTSLFPATTVSLSAGDQLTVTIGAVACGLAAVGDFIWLDENNDGVQDGTEGGVAGVEVSLLDTTNTLIAIQVTQADGNYLFTNVPIGSYYLQFSLPNGFSATQMNSGSDETIDSDVDPILLKTTSFTLGSDLVDQKWDLGLIRNPTASPEEAEPASARKLFLPLISN